MNRYIDCDEDLVEVFMKVLEERFPQYGHLTFKLVYDLKKRINKGNVVLASIEVASPKIKYFSRDDRALDGYDYVLIVDQKVWQLAAPKDRERVISHELRHVFIDDKGNTKIIGHEINDFYQELKLNSDDPEWARKLATIVVDVYDQEKELIKAERVKKGVQRND